MNSQTNICLEKSICYSLYIADFIGNISVNTFVSEHVTKHQQHLYSSKVPGITRSTSFKGVHKTESPPARFNVDGARSLPSTSRMKPTHETSHLHPNNLSPMTGTSRTVTGPRQNMIRQNSKQECEYGKLMGEICFCCFRPDHTQTSLPSYRGKLESFNFAGIKFRYKHV